MLKAMIDGNYAPTGKPVRVVVLGLSHWNLERLRAGRPIDIDAEEELGLAGTRILIFSGETEQSMAREMHELIGPNTKVTIDPRLRD